MNRHCKHEIMRLIKTLAVACILVTTAHGSEYLHDDFSSFGGWIYGPGDHGSFASNGAYAYVADWRTQSEVAAEKPLSSWLLPQDDFSLSLNFSSGPDTSGKVGAVGVMLLDASNRTVAQLAWHDAQASTGYGGVDFYAEGGKPIYRTDPRGFGQEYPEFWGNLTLKRLESQWSAWVDGTQKGATLSLTPTLTATKAQIFATRAIDEVVWPARDVRIDELTVSGPPSASVAREQMFKDLGSIAGGYATACDPAYWFAQSEQKLGQICGELSDPIHQTVEHLKTLGIELVVPGVAEIIKAADAMGTIAQAYEAIKCTSIGGLEARICNSLPEELTKLQDDLSDGIPSADMLSTLALITAEAETARDYFIPRPGYPDQVDGNPFNTPGNCTAYDWQNEVRAYGYAPGFLYYSLLPSVVNFADGVRLTVTTIPEPTSLSLSLLGLSATTAVLRRRRSIHAHSGLKSRT